MVKANGYVWYIRMGNSVDFDTYIHPYIHPWGKQELIYDDVFIGWFLFAVCVPFDYLIEFLMPGSTRREVRCDPWKSTSKHLSIAIEFCTNII